MSQYDQFQLASINILVNFNKQSSVHETVWLSLNPGWIFCIPTVWIVCHTLIWNDDIIIYLKEQSPKSIEMDPKRGMSPRGEGTFSSLWLTEWFWVNIQTACLPKHFKLWNPTSSEGLNPLPLWSWTRSEVTGCFLSPSSVIIVKVHSSDREGCISGSLTSLFFWSGLQAKQQFTLCGLHEVSRGLAKTSQTGNSNVNTTVEGLDQEQQLFQNLINYWSISF